MLSIRRGKSDLPRLRFCTQTSRIASKSIHRVCDQCGIGETIDCGCTPYRSISRNSAGLKIAQAVKSALVEKKSPYPSPPRHEASPLHTSQAMESSGGAHVAPAMSHFESADRFALGGDAMTGNMYSGNDMIPSNGRDLYETTMPFDAMTPQHVAFTNPFQDSNERGMQQEQPGATRANDEMAGASSAQAAIALADADHAISLPDFNEFPYAEEYTSRQELDVQSQAGTVPTSADFTYSASEPEQAGPKSMAGYAQLCFNDGEFVISTLAVILGRDSYVQKEYQRERDRLTQHQQAAEAALEEYKKEPSNASHPDDNPQSKSEHSLDGRPAPGLPSMASEQGGIVNLAGETEQEQDRKRLRAILRRRKAMASAQSSSSASVNPARLHKGFAYEMDDQTFVGTDGTTVPFVAVHTNDPKDLTKISREHARIAYNNSTGGWEMEVLGKQAMVHNEHSYEAPACSHDRSFNWTTTEAKLHTRGALVPLTHNTEIMFSTLRFTFRLPAQTDPNEFNLDEMEPQSEGSDVEVGNSSPARRLSAAMSGEDEAEQDDADSEPEVALADVSRENSRGKKKKKAEKKQKSGLKLKLKSSQPAPEVAPSKSSPELSKKAAKKPKKSMSVPEPATNSESAAAAAATTTPDKATVPNPDAPVAAADGSAPPVKASAPTQPTTRAPEPLVFEKGTLLGDAVPEELPEKRKGPGRPPKNGLISKRDHAILTRRYQDYDKQGIPRPPMKELLDIVRAENKAKEAAAKAAARGEQMVMQSIEGGVGPHAASMNGPRGAGNGKIKRSTDDALARASAELADAVAAESKAEAKRTRTWRSPSPVKPEEECTEEELKKPTSTYYITLEAILGNGPPEGLELQQIYDKVMKMYPYFKYKSESTGWQSSVRHNLKQHPRFQQSTKQGKGWMWSINPDVPYNGDVRKKKPSPPRVPQQQQNGGPLQFQYGNPYAQQFSQQGQQGQQYASPYQRGQQYGNANQQQQSRPVGIPRLPPSALYVPYYPVRGYESLHPNQHTYTPPQPGQQPPQPPQAPAPPEPPSLINDMIALRLKYQRDPQQAPGLGEDDRIALFDRIMSWYADPKQRVAVPSPLEADLDRQMAGIWAKWKQSPDGKMESKSEDAVGTPAGGQGQMVPGAAGAQAPVQSGGANVLPPTSTVGSADGTGVAAPAPALANGSARQPSGTALSAFKTAPATINANNAWRPSAPATNGAYQQPAASAPTSQVPSQAPTSGRPTPSPLSSAAVPSRPLSQHGPPAQANGTTGTTWSSASQRPLIPPHPPTALPTVATPAQAAPLQGFSQPSAAYGATRQSSAVAQPSPSPKTTVAAPAPSVYPQAQQYAAPQPGSAAARPMPPIQQTAAAPYGAALQQPTPVHGLPTPQMSAYAAQKQQPVVTSSASVAQAFAPQTSAPAPQQQSVPQPAPTLKRSASDEVRDGKEGGAAKRARLE